MRRYELLQSIHPVIETEVVVCNIGIPSQELYHIGDRETFFYMLGSMGLCSSIGLGLALRLDRPVIAIEGDGAVLMNLGALSTIAHHAPAHYILLVVDNGAYGSTGDQPTPTQDKTDLAAVARAAGCARVISTTGPETRDVLASALADESAATVIVSRVAAGSEPVAPIPLSPIAIRDRIRDLVKE
jgi:sulfopyruvate decarboxylase subunit beta